MIRDIRMRFKSSSELPYMVLPDAVIKREKERMRGSEILIANFATTNELLAKHQRFEIEQAITRRLRDRIAEGKTLDEWDLFKAAEGYSSIGLEGQAKEYYRQAYDLIKDQVKQPTYLRNYDWPQKFMDMKILVNMGEIDEARKIYQNLQQDELEKNSEGLQKYLDIHPELVKQGNGGSGDILRR